MYNTVQNTEIRAEKCIDYKRECQEEKKKKKKYICSQLIVHSTETPEGMGNMTKTVSIFFKRVFFFSSFVFSKKKNLSSKQLIRFKMFNASSKNLVKF